MNTSARGLLGTSLKGVMGGGLTRTTSGRRSSSAETEGIATALRSPFSHPLAGGFEIIH